MKDMISGLHTPTASTRLSRRAFVGLAALTALAGCAPAPLLGDSSATPVATHPPTPIPPSGTISAANAGAIKQLTSFHTERSRAGCHVVTRWAPARGWRR